MAIFTPISAIRLAFSLIGRITVHARPSAGSMLAPWIDPIRERWTGTVVIISVLMVHDSLLGLGLALAWLVGQDLSLGLRLVLAIGMS